MNWFSNRATACSRPPFLTTTKQELEAGGDELAAWAASTAPASCFASTDAPDTIAEFIAMVEWVQGQQQFYPEAKAEFAGGTDGWLVAHAKARELVVVTHEVYAPDGRKKVPIPNVCRAFGVPCVNTFEMLGGLQTQFTWTPPT